MLGLRRGTADPALYQHTAFRQISGHLTQQAGKSRAVSFESERALVAAILQAIVANHWKFMR